MRLEISAQDQVMSRFGNQLAMLGDGRAKQIMAVSANKVGRGTRTEIERALVAQTGLKKGAVSRSITMTRASANHLEWALHVTGRNIPLKEFNPREVRGGVKHTSKADPNPYPGGFTRVGGFIYNAKKRDVTFRMGARKATGRFGGHVMINTAGGAWGGSVKTVMSKVRLDQEVFRGAAIAAYHRMPPKIADEVGRILAAILGGSLGFDGKGRLKGTGPVTRIYDPTTGKTTTIGQAA